MKVICAPDKFKGSLSAAEAAAAMARGVRRAVPEAVLEVCPIADGGEGTVEAMLAATGGRAMTTRVTGPLWEPVEARWGWFHEENTTGNKIVTAVIEMAAASGLQLLPPSHRDPTRTTTFGTGELIRTALDAGAQRIILGIGGSATNDGGSGMAAALGVTFLNHQAQPIAPQHLLGGRLDGIVQISLDDLDPRLRRGGVRITVACDVTNPLTGPRGAAYVYGPQKGATPAQVEQLDRNLAHLAAAMRQWLGRDVQTLPGAGAAGGLGGGLVAFLGAELRPGIDLVLDAVGFQKRLNGASLCLTGEGRLDAGSLAGKACVGVARACRARGVSVVALVGALGEGVDQLLASEGLVARVIGPGLPPERSMREAAVLLERAAERVAAEAAGRAGESHG